MAPALVLLVRRTLRSGLGLLVALAVSTAAWAWEYPSKKPDAKAPAHTWFEDQSKGGLRYLWELPEDYDPSKPRNLTVILHGSNLDRRWGPANNPTGVFRPDDVVVSVDGTTPAQGEARNFLGEKKDVEAFAGFLTEMRASFAVKNVFLYGHSQGGFFVVYFAGEHPEMVSGVVAQASGAWNGSKTTGAVKKVAIAFLHGTLDPVVPYGQSPGARDAYAKEGLPLLHLRRMQNWNHWPNAVRATESLDWCEGMTTDDPATALECARRILAPKKSDEYQWTTVVGFSGARDVLRRIEGKGPAAFKSVDAKVATAAAEIVKKIEEHASKHVKALAKDVPSRKELAKPGEWLGHLIALREDFRGVDAVEAYVSKIAYDDVLASQSKSSRAIFSAWYDEKDPKKIYETIVEKIEEAFLVEGYPVELGSKMDEWKNDAKKLEIGKKPLEKFAAFEAWRSGWKKGLERYEKLWNDWKAP